MDRVKALTAIVVCAILAGCASGPGSSSSTSGLYTFGLIGDLAYRPEQEPQMQNVLDDLNAVELAIGCEKASWLHARTVAARS